MLRSSCAAGRERVDRATPRCAAAPGSTAWLYRRLRAVTLPPQLIDQAILEGTHRRDVSALRRTEHDFVHAWLQLFGFAQRQHWEVLTCRALLGQPVEFQVGAAKHTEHGA